MARVNAPNQAWIDIDVEPGMVYAKMTQAEQVVSGVGMRGFFALAHAHLMSRARDRFAGEGDYASGRWARLAESTVAHRIAQGYPGSNPINVRSGELKNFILGDQPKVLISPVASEMVTPGTTPAGDLLTKFEVAQKGSGKTPARPVLATDGRDVAAILSTMAVYLKEALR